VGFSGALKDAVRPFRTALGRFIVPPEPPTSTIIYKAAEIVSSEHIEGDYLEPFVDPVFPPAALTGAPDFDHPGRIVMGDEKRQIGAANSLMLMNRGTDHDVRAGQTVTIFRETMGGKGPLLEVGHGTVLNVRPQTSLIRIDATREAVYLGDLVAIHRITQ